MTSSVNNNFQWIEWQDYSGKDYDIAVPLNQFYYENQKKARLARNVAFNRGLVGKIIKRQFLLFEHIDILKDWVSNHNFYPVTVSIASSIQGILKYENVYLIEARIDEALLGFAVLSILNSEIAVILQMFMKNISHGRVGDSIMASAIEFCKEQGLSRLHLGYSDTPNIRQFKEKWGGFWKGPDYVYCICSCDTLSSKRISQGMFLWRDRLIDLCTNRYNL